MKYLYAFIIFLLFNYIFSQSVRSKLDKTAIEIGSPITYILEASLENKEKVIFPILKDSLAHKLEIISIKYDSIFKNNNNIYSQQIVFTSFDAGKYAIDPLIIKIGNSIYATPTFQIEVTEPNVPDNATLNPIKDIYKKPPTLWDKILDFLNQTWVKIILAIFISFILLYLMYKFYKKSNKSNKTTLLLTSAEIALQKLQSLEDKKLMEGGEAKKYYSELIAILKEYMSKRFTFSAFQLISSDVIDYIKVKRLINKREETNLITIFNAADLAKFAKSQPTLQDSKEHLQLAKEFIESSKYIPIIEPQNVSHVS